MMKRFITFIMAIAATATLFGCSLERNKTGENTIQTEITSEDMEMVSKDTTEETNQETSTQEMAKLIFYINGIEYELPQTLGELKKMLENVAFYDDKEFYLKDENKWIMSVTLEDYNDDGKKLEDFEDNLIIEEVRLTEYGGLSIPGGIVSICEHLEEPREEFYAIKTTLEELGFKVEEYLHEGDGERVKELEAKVNEREWYSILFEEGSFEPDSIMVYLIREID